MSQYPIPFNLPYQPARAIELIETAFPNRKVSGAGELTLQAEGTLQSICKTPAALLTTSCTHALEMSSLLLDIGPGDEVIVPSFTFVSTANAYLLHGGTPVFVDIRPDTLNIDETLIEEKITSRTRAIVVVHYGGIACEMDTIRDIGNKHGIPIIEDNAHGLFGTYRDAPLGSLGTLSALSFHETKNISCGEGGALLINDSKYFDQARIIREKGTDRSLLAERKVGKSNWAGLGSSYVLSEILAAFLVAALEDASLTQSSRHHAWYRYAKELRSWAEKNGVQLPHVPAHCSHPAHLFYLLCPTLDARTRVIDHLKTRGILSVFHYLPLDQSPMAKKLQLPSSPCRVTSRVSDALLRLPLYNCMPESSIDSVIDAVTELTL